MLVNLNRVGNIFIETRGRLMFDDTVVDDNQQVVNSGPKCIPRVSPFDRSSRTQSIAPPKPGVERAHSAEAPFFFVLKS